MQRAAPAGLYESDFALWIDQQVDILRRGVLDKRLGELDVQNVIEELESLGNGERDSLQSHLTTLIVHMLKLQFQPDQASRSWLGSIVSRAARIRRIIRRSPSLNKFLAQCAEEAFHDAKLQAAAETGLPIAAFPPTMDPGLQKLIYLAIAGDDFGGEEIVQRSAMKRAGSYRVRRGNR